MRVLGFTLRSPTNLLTLFTSESTQTKRRPIQAIKPVVKKAAHVRYWHLADMSKHAFNVRFGGKTDIENQGALTICLHAGGNPASVKTGFGLLGGGCSVDSLNQKSSSLPQPSLGSGAVGGLHSAPSAGQVSWI
jgi:hypothetical protein